MGWIIQKNTELLNIIRCNYYLYAINHNVNVILSESKIGILEANSSLPDCLELYRVLRVEAI